MIRGIATLTLVASFSFGTMAFGQQADWSRLTNTGDAAMASHQYSDAESAYRAALDIAEKSWKGDARISDSLVKLAESCNAQSKKEEAESLAQRSIASLEETLKTHKPKNASDEVQQSEVSASLLDKAGDIFSANQKYGEAEALYKEAIAAREKYTAEMGKAKPRAEDFYRFMAQSLVQTKIADENDKLANLYLIQRKFPEAEASYTKSEAIREKKYGPDDPRVADSLNNLATCYAQQGQYERAEPLYTRAIAIFDRSGDTEHPQRITTLKNYALLLKKVGRDAESAEILQRANAMRAKSASEQR